MPHQKGKKLVPDNEEQSKIFLKKAREIEAAEDKSAADELLGRLAKRAPEPHKPRRGEK